MTVFPAIIDSRPRYHAPGSDHLSVTLLPHGDSTVLQRISIALQQQVRRRPTIVRTFASSDAYEQALAAAGGGPSRSVEQLYAGFEEAEPSDWVLLVDSRCFPKEGYHAPGFFEELFEELAAAPRIARHLVALDWGVAGTSERVEFDAEGRVRRIQRYYDALTWTVTTGVLCSLVPVSSLMVAGAVEFSSLAEFRSRLSAPSLPSRDVPYRGPVFDLESERGLLRLTEHILHDSGAADRHRPAIAPIMRRHRATVHPTARLLGTVVLQAGAVVGDDVTIVGPTVVGTDARIERGAIVAQAVVPAGTVVGAGCVVRHRVARCAGAASIDANTFESGAVEESDPVDLHEETTRRPVYPMVKRVVESLAAGVALLVLSPLLLIIAVLIKLESRGSVLYGDLREAKHGRPFSCYKFRTMVAGADAAQRDLMAANQVDGPQFKMVRDPRVTRLGRFLRAVSLDELPQLINVVMGQMSLVGPRPSPFRENQTCVPWRDARLSVRPGITGLWQVCRHDRSSGDFHQWIYYDMQYVRHISPWVDLKVLIATVLTLGGKGRVPLSWIVPLKRDMTIE
jgi:lipopolysaccharide/colanic/teichoic acid biosynthesis glycosyltransferase